MSAPGFPPGCEALVRDMAEIANELAVLRDMLRSLYATADSPAEVRELAAAALGQVGEAFHVMGMEGQE